MQDGVASAGATPLYGVLSLTLLLVQEHEEFAVPNVAQVSLHWEADQSWPVVFFSPIFF
jgi:hypothetical protein